MASLKDDSINFDKLENEVDEAMKAENLYWLQNDAKFRAVKQKGTYEEFKYIYMLLTMLFENLVFIKHNNVFAKVQIKKTI